MKIVKMKKIIISFFLLLLPVVGWADFPINSSWESISNGWSCVNRTKSGAFPDTHYSAESTSGTPDPSYALKITFPAGWPSAAEPATCWNVFGSRPKEIYIQYYLKYSPGYQWQSVFDKSIYILTGPGNYFVFVGAGHGRPGIRMQSDMDSISRGQNIGPTFTFATGVWYKINLHLKMNTSSSAADGIGEMWVNDTKIISYSNIGFSKDTTGFYEIDITPVWGGTGSDTVAVKQYQYYGRTIVQSTPIDGPVGGPVGNSLNPMPPSKLQVEEIIN